jgi:hypothetical protein
LNWIRIDTRDPDWLQMSLIGIDEIGIDEIGIDETLIDLLPVGENPVNLGEGKAKWAV